MNPLPPLTIAVLAKQVPRNDDVKLQTDGRLQREGVELEMDAYSRRAVAKGIELAHSSKGRCVVFSMGPPSAIDVLREAIAAGADRGFLLSDPVLAGSDTLATARALVQALRLTGPFDLILLGRSSVDAETAQLGPQIAQMLKMPFASAVKNMELQGEKVYVHCEVDYGYLDAVVDTPCVLGVAERLCSPAKADKTTWDAIPSEKIETITTDLLGKGPWGKEASPTRVAVTTPISIRREHLILHGPPDDQVARAIETIVKWDLFDLNDSANASHGKDRSFEDKSSLVLKITRDRSEYSQVAQGKVGSETPVDALQSFESKLGAFPDSKGSINSIKQKHGELGRERVSRTIAVILEPERAHLGEELLALAASLSNLPAQPVQSTIKAVLPHSEGLHVPVIPVPDRSNATSMAEIAHPDERPVSSHHRSQPGGEGMSEWPGGEGMSEWPGGEGMSKWPGGEGMSEWLAKLGMANPAILDLLDELIIFEGDTTPFSLASPISRWMVEDSPWLMLTSSTSWGREMAGRIGAELGVGVVADAVGLDVHDGGGLIAWKPSLGGLVKAGIISSSHMQVVTVRPGSTGISLKSNARIRKINGQKDRAQPRINVRVERVVPQGKMTVLQRTHEDDPELLQQASFVVGVGQGVEPDGYEEIKAFADSIGASLAATRKVTDKGLLPRSRQVGITGTSILAKLYIAIGISGKPSHLAGCSGVDHIIAINSDPNADIFKVADLGLTGDWRQIIPKLREALTNTFSQWRLHELT